MIYPNVIGVMGLCQRDGQARNNKELSDTIRYKGLVEYEYPHQPNNITSGVVLCGFRHGCIFAQLNFASQGSLKSVADRHMSGVWEKSQGFITNLGRYVEREEALQIALAADQVYRRII